MLAQRLLKLLIVFLLAEWLDNPRVQHLYELAGLYERKDVICTRAQIYKNTSYLAVPRLKPGTQMTLLKLQPAVGHSQCTGQSILEAFPRWQLQEEGACDKFAIQSAVDLFLDNEHELWVLDIGVCNTLSAPVLRCKPKIVAYDVRSGEIINNIVIDALVEPESRLQYLVVDKDHVGNRFIYISDASSRALLIWNVTDSTGYRLILPEFVTMGCATLDMLYLALVHKSSGSYLYFTYLGSSRLFSLATKYLQTDPHTANDFIIDCGSKPHGLKMALLGTDNASSLYIRYKGHNDIFVWDTEHSFEAKNFKEVGHQSAPTILAGYKHFMWTLESDIYSYMNGTTGCRGTLLQLYPAAKQCDL